MRDIASPLDGFASPFGPGRRTLANLLFGQNEPGFTFEPWDITTLYQDRAGTTPVTAVGQSVGLRLDKSQGLRLGPELGFATLQVSDLTVIGGSVVVTDLGDRLRLTRTAAAGGPTQAQVSSGVVSAGQYYRASFTLLATGTSNNAYIGVNNGGGTDFIPSAYYAGASAQSRLQIATAAGTGRLILRLAVSRGANPASSIEGDWIEISKTYSVKSLAGNHQVAVSDAKRGVYGWMPKTGRRNLLNATDTLSTQSVTVTAVAHTLAFTGTGTVTLSGVSTAGPLIGTGASNRVTLTFTPTAGSLTLTVSGSVTLAQLEIGSTDTAYQRVASQYEITEAGVPTCYYVQADGVDDAYVTPTITPGTDKVQVFAGVRKQGTAEGALVEYSNSFGSADAFGITIPSNAGDTTSKSYMRGATIAATLTVPASPANGVLTSIFDNTAGTVQSRINQGSYATASGSASGNFAAYPAYTYGRGGTSLPFNGLDFGHAVRFGPNLDAATIARVEALIARNTPEVTL